MLVIIIAIPPLYDYRTAFQCLRNGLDLHVHYTLKKLEIQTKFNRRSE